MKILKLYLVPLAAIIGLVLLADLLKIIPPHISQILFIATTFMGMIPMAQEILSSMKRKTIDLSIPVFATLFILLFIKEYWIAAIFTWMMLLGRIFKEYILWKVEQSVKEISKSLPNIAYLKTDDIREVPLDKIKKADVLVVKAGGRIPVDGVMISEEATIDESVITGESKPVSKIVNDKLVAGSISLSSYMEMRATDTSANSTLAQISKMVAEAQSRNTQLSRFTTFYAIGTSLVALAGTILIYMISGNLLKALAFWIALIPVIFAIIVPVATTIGISILAKKGVMVKTPGAFEDLTRIDSMVFDKTGTLTKGAPEISDILLADEKSNVNDFLQLAASVEKYSDHPLSRPIMKSAKEKKLTLQQAESINVIKGRGITAVCMGKKVAIGNKPLMEMLSVVVPVSVEETTKQRENEGNSTLYVAINNSFAGVIYMSDPLRENIKNTMDELKAMHIKRTMLTGDNNVVAAKVASAVGLTRFYAGLMPQDKIKYIQQFKAAGEKVIMTGDGINDAPALSEANVGVAMGLRGVDVTLNSASVVLINDDIQAMPYVLKTSKKVMGIIKFNLIIATTIHVAAAILSVTGFVSLLGSALIHQVSSTIVILNTLRLFSKGKKGA